MSRDQYSHMRQQFCGVNDYCDAHGSIYPKIKIMAVWRQIHHAGHTPPRNHDLPHWCDFPDASSVPCECIFSSSKETDTLRRSQLSPEMMEMLQMLKFQFQSERLDFNNNWVSSEGELSVMDISPEVVKGMISEQRISDLDNLIDSSFI